MPITGQQYLARALHEYQVTHVFMVPTSFVGASVEMDRLGIQVIMTHGEKAAAYMADGYARLRNSPGICHSQNIGAANLAAGLRDPFMAGSPVIALTGGKDPLTAYKHLYQEIDDFPIFESVTKANVQVRDVRRLPDMLRQAFREATSGWPAPVHLEVDGLSGSLLDQELTLPDGAGPLAEPQFSQVPAVRPMPDEALLAQAVSRLAAAQRPVIVAGGGVKWSGAQAEVLELARRLQIPVATSMNAKGCIDERDPLAVGVVGSYSRASANQTLMEADLVLFVGSHTGSQVTDGWRLPAPGTEVIQIDIDPAELGRSYPNSVAIMGDAATALRRMAKLAADAPVSHEGWAATAREYVEKWRADHESLLRSDAVPIRPERLCSEINAALPDDGVLLSDTGHSGIWTASMFDLKPGQSYLRCAGSLGWAFPASIGAACAAGDRKVICFTGDGGIYYHLAELETAARYQIPVVVVVNDNRSLSQDLMPYRSAYDWKPSAMGDKMWLFDQVDLAATARSLGCAAFRVEDPGDIATALREALDSGRPTVIDVSTEVEAFPDPPYGGRNFYDKKD
jgi:acetolactate synthase-1/2/3 large subunit